MLINILLPNSKQIKIIFKISIYHLNNLLLVNFNPIKIIYKHLKLFKMIIRSYIKIKQKLKKKILHKISIIIELLKIKHKNLNSFPLKDKYLKLIFKNKFKINFLCMDLTIIVLKNKTIKMKTIILTKKKKIKILILIKN